ncbi:hypothetical protein [Dactylosporangium sp. CA-139066]|uniref:hypothetical protein n=1 Tax=Dactylosporangium sp. CA-139066 TaxID=3239930 RepID=UPI003D8A79E7
MTTMFEFDSEVWGHGWAQAALRHGDQDAILDASYITRALVDLLRALVSLVDGYREGYVEWCEEPGEYRWRLRREPDQEDVVSVAVLWFPRWEGIPDDGERRFDTRLKLADLVTAIVAAARRVLDDIGVAGYRQRWGEPFPSLELQILEPGWLRYSCLRRPEPAPPTACRPPRPAPTSAGPPTIDTRGHCHE